LIKCHNHSTERIRCWKK